MNASLDPIRNDQISASLPTRITGIVFWGTLLVGLLIALIMLHSRESELASNRKIATMFVGSSIENVLEQHVSKTLLKSNRILLTTAIQRFQSESALQAVELSSQDDTFLIGKLHPNQTLIKRELQIHVSQSETPLVVQMTAYFPSLEDTVTKYRKNILMIIGMIVVIYALILQQIFNRLLSRPFSNMITTAKIFADGQVESRFDEKFDNEFGFLSKFINRALDAIAEKQKELSDALVRATTSEVALFREKERAEVTLQSISEAVLTTNAAGEVQYLNPVAERITGWGNQEARGHQIQSIIKIVQENSGKPLFNPVPECLKNNKVEHLASHATLLRRDGEMVAIEATAAPMRNDKGEVIGAVMVCQDVTQARKLAIQLTHQAGHDSLTGLYNRREFDRKLCDLLENSKLSGAQHILLYLDLDQFKIVNDTCGHSAGDKLLIQLSILLGQKVRKNDILARLGGDEFGVLLMGCDVEYGKKIADTFLRIISDFRFVWEDKIFQVGVSIGLVPITAASENSAEVMSAADAACYVAKDEGRNRIQISIGSERRGQKYSEMQWVPRIHKAIEEGRLKLYRQNIVPVSSDIRSDHAEILLRMESEDGIIIPPMAFIPAAERYNLMPMIDRWVVKNALKWLALNSVSSTEHSQWFSLNISGHSLGDEQFLGYILEQFEQTGVPYNRICLEITETTAIANIGLAIAFISALKEKGCTFALDDFGSGMSSYSYLKTLDVDFLKIDGSFVKDMANDPVDLAMVESINRIGHVMGLKTIAEFVESEATLIELRRLGVNYAQGYYLHSPELLHLTE